MHRVSAPAPYTLREPCSFRDSMVTFCENYHERNVMFEHPTAWEERVWQYYDQLLIAFTAGVILGKDFQFAIVHGTLAELLTGTDKVLAARHLADFDGRATRSATMMWRQI